MSEKDVILIVEDSAFVGLQIQKIVEDLRTGHETVWVKDLQTAKETIDTRNVAAVITDNNFPRSLKDKAAGHTFNSGAELAKYIRVQKGNNTLPILVASAGMSYDMVHTNSRQEFLVDWSRAAGINATPVYKPGILATIDPYTCACDKDPKIKLAITHFIREIAKLPEVASGRGPE